MNILERLDEHIANLKTLELYHNEYSEVANFTFKDFCIGVGTDTLPKWLKLSTASFGLRGSAHKKLVNDGNVMHYIRDYFSIRGDDEKIFSMSVAQINQKYGTEGLAFSNFAHTCDFSVTFMPHKHNLNWVQKGIRKRDDHSFKEILFEGFAEKLEEKRDIALESAETIKTAFKIDDLDSLIDKRVEELGFMGIIKLLTEKKGIQILF